MRPGETMCYYRARGGQKSVYVTVMYDGEEGLRSSIVQSNTMPVIDVCTTCEVVNETPIVSAC